MEENKLVELLSELQKFKGDMNNRFNQLEEVQLLDTQNLNYRFDRLEEAQRQDTQNLNKRLDSMDERFDAVDTRLDSVNARFDSVDARFIAIDERFDAVDTRFDRLEDVQREMLQMMKDTRTEARREAKHIANLQIRQQRVIEMLSANSMQQSADIRALEGEVEEIKQDLHKN